jgi:hypothetical protein
MDFARDSLSSLRKMVSSGLGSSRKSGTITVVDIATGMNLTEE